MKSIPFAMVRESVPAPKQVASLPTRRPFTHAAICDRLALIPSGVMAVVLTSATITSCTDDARHHLAIAERVFFAGDLLFGFMPLAGHHHHITCVTEGDRARY